MWKQHLFINSKQKLVLLSIQFSKYFLATLESKTKTLFRWNYEHQQDTTQSPHLFLRQDETRPNGSSCHLNDEFLQRRN